MPVALRNKLSSFDVSSKCWHINGSGYPQSLIGNAKPMLHVYLLGKRARFIVDHIDHDPLNARRSNLHHATSCFNTHNRVTTSLPGFRGVQITTRRDGAIRYKAKICHNYKHISLGTYTTALLAACAHDHASRHIYGDHAMNNGVGDQEGHTWDMTTMRLIKTFTCVGLS